MKWNRISAPILTLLLVFSFNLPAAMAQMEEEYVEEAPEKDWHIIPGLKLGGYFTSLTPDGESSIDFSGFAYGPSIDAWYKKFGFGFSFLHAPSLEWDEDTDMDISRFDLDTIFKYRFNNYLQAFTGIRYENNDMESLDYSIFLIPALGGAFSYPFDFGLTPYIVGVLFPYGTVDYTYREEIFPGITIKETGSESCWGIGTEFGVAYSFNFPLTLSFGYKIQYLSFDTLEELIQYLYGGVFYRF